MRTEAATTGPEFGLSSRGAYTATLAVDCVAATLGTLPCSCPYWAYVRSVSNLKSEAARMQQGSYLLSTPPRIGYKTTGASFQLTAISTSYSPFTHSAPRKTIQNISFE